MAADYRIPWQAPDLLPGINLLLGVNKENREQERADLNTQINATNAHNSFVKTSAEEARASQEAQDRRDERIRQRGIEQADALEKVKHHIRSGDIGQAKALASAYGIDLHEAAHAAGAEDGQKAQEALPLLLQAAAPPSSTELMSPAESAPPVEQPPEMAQAPVGQHSGSPVAPQPQAEAAPDIPPAVENKDFAPKTLPLLYEAAMNGQVYPLGAAGGEKTGLGDQYDQLYRGLLDAGWDESKAREYVLKQHHTDVTESAKDARLATAISGRDVHLLTTEQKLAEAEKNRQNALAAARIRASAAPGSGPTPPSVADLIAMKEAGASDAEVYAEAARRHLAEKQFVQPVQNAVKNAATGERAGQKREALTATDDEGKVLGVWKDANAAKIGEKQIESYHRVKERLAELIADIKKTGSRTDLNIDQIQNRVSKAKAVAAALRPFNELSNTAAGQKMEDDILGQIGTPGHGWLWGANLGIVERLAHEAEGQHQAQLNTKLRPGGGSKLAPALGGPKEKKGSALDDLEAQVDALVGGK